MCLSDDGDVWRSGVQSEDYRALGLYIASVALNETERKIAYQVILMSGHDLRCAKEGMVATGSRVAKDFGGKEYRGVVVELTEKIGIIYEDGDSECLPLHEVLPILTDATDKCQVIESMSVSQSCDTTCASTCDTGWECNNCTYINESKLEFGLHKTYHQCKVCRYVLDTTSDLYAFLDEDDCPPKKSGKKPRKKSETELTDDENRDYLGGLQDNNDGPCHDMNMDTVVLVVDTPNIERDKHGRSISSKVVRPKYKDKKQFQNTVRLSDYPCVCFT